MTIPQDIKHATRQFDAFMADLMAISMLATSNQGYHMTRAVLHVFRSHLEVGQALAFAEVLPPVLRAIFVERWHPADPEAFPDREALQEEVMAVRGNHNTSTPAAIADVATALRRHVDVKEFERVLSTLPEAAKDFWR